MPSPKPVVGESWWCRVTEFPIVVEMLVQEITSKTIVLRRKNTALGDLRYETKEVKFVEKLT